MSNQDPKSLVESMIDSMVSGNVSASDAVNTVLNRNTGDSDIVTFKEGEAIVCPECGSHNMEEGFLESEDGESTEAYQCADCGTQLVEEASEDDEPELVEAEIDEDNPACPVCGSDEIYGGMVESEDGEDELFLCCEDCGATMVAIG